MWRLMDRLARPSLARHLELRALEHNQGSLLLLRAPAADPAWSAALLANVRATSACWQVFRPVLPAERWGAVRAGLRSQRRLLRPLAPWRAVAPARAAAWLADLRACADGSREADAVARLADAVAAAPGSAPSVAPSPALHQRRRDALEQTLVAESAWLAELVDAAPNEAAVRGGARWLYARAQRHVTRRPGSARARRWIGHLTAWAELLVEPAGHNWGSRFSELVTAGRRLEESLDQRRWLGALLTDEAAAARVLRERDRRRLAGPVERRRRGLQGTIRCWTAELLGESPDAFAAALPWEIFRCLSAAPGPVVQWRGDTDRRHEEEGH
jgi:hypothetical protein